MAVSEELHLVREDATSFAWEKPWKISKDMQQFISYKNWVFETCHSSITFTSQTLMHGRYHATYGLVSLAALF